MVLRSTFRRNAFTGFHISSVTILFLFVVSFTLSTLSFAQSANNPEPRKTTQEDRELIKFKKNRVKTRTAIITYHGNYAKAMPSDVITEYIICDARGNKIEHTRFRGGESVDTKWLFEYDENGNVIKLTGIDDFGKVVNTRISQYDNEFKEIERNEVRANIKDTFKTVFKYNGAGLVSEIETLRSTGERIWFEEYEYDGNKLMEKTSYDQKGEVVSTIKYKHNSAGQIIDEIDTTPGKEEFSTDTYRYDNRGNVIEHKTGSFRQLYSYNNNGDVIEDILFNILGNRQHKFKITYNDKGLMNTQVRLSPVDKLVYTVKYEYEFH